ncbi:beta-eliminating lyase-related protein [Nostoc sp. ChiQUE01b]|uniref:beta-eliminating lyase-related protein n=1 Tax=Nostoc sp. ChiQUE01b TaxID=3075376 RepID=UPI002AD1E687|nr:beta-eliminating lyase-related protein [Nostoc sp. ChiQUE01b]MDZ8264206.1 beta-eliminating lyase-related protein [Nostoc sp. ChiQUE01b]
MSIAERMQVLQLTGHNLDIIPGKHIELDLQTDSLMHQSLSEWSEKEFADSASPEQIFSQNFGFPYVIAVSQGRLAEAILSHAIIRNGHYIPGSALFPTTRIHQERNGGTSVEVMCAESIDINSSYSFKGNIDINALERGINTYHPAWIPYICIEPCNNAVGGHPMSLENMRSLADLARHYQIPIYLDACRIVDNALMIQEREEGYQNTSVDEIIREFCSYADGCTMSATKDFPTPIGGFLAVRDPKLFYRCLDYLILFGAGLSRNGQQILAHSITDMDRVSFLVRQRINLVKKLHQALGNYPNLVQPAGGHGVFLNINAEYLAIPDSHQPAQAFLYQLFRDYGIRGSLNHSSPTQIANNISLVRFAVPILGLEEEAITQVADGISSLFTAKNNIQGLKIVEKGPGLTGFLRAKYRPIDRVSSN